MRLPQPTRRLFGMLLVLIPLAALFVLVALRTGPLAPVPVTVATVEAQPVQPARYGIGTVEARFRHRIGPTLPGRVKRVVVDVGDRVRAGQLLAEMDEVDLEARIRAARAAAQAAEARLKETEARVAFAATELRRYERMLASQSTSEESVANRRLEYEIARATRLAARREHERARAEHDALLAQRDHLRLLAPVNGLVVSRLAEAGDTLVSGQPVVEVIDPQQLWIEARFDQTHAGGLAAGQPARIVLRSRPDGPLPGKVLRVEPLADSVTEELRARIVFDRPPSPLPPLGELAEVTVALPPRPAAPTVPNAALQYQAGRIGVWRLESGRPVFTPVRTGASDLEGRVQIKAGLKVGDRIVVYSRAPLHEGSSVRIVDRIPGVPR